ncbi:MAG: hypothetical protein ABW092_09230 [Candidatus Thiodiazotropha sp.]
MNKGKGSTSINRFIGFALVVSIVSLILFVSVEVTSSETSTALWFVLLILLIFVSLPVHGMLLIFAILRLVQKNRNTSQWLYLYLFIAIVGHAGVAANYGAFDEVSNDISQHNRKVENPAQIQLERALARGPVSNVTEVREALNNGADPNGMIFDNRMPLLVLVASRADTKSIKALLDAGADPKKRSTVEYVMKNRGVVNASALDIVLYSEYESVADSVKLLLAAGSELAKANDLGQYPLDVAIANNQYEAAFYIARAGGTANMKDTIENIMQNDSEDVRLEELKRLFLKDGKLK